MKSNFTKVLLGLTACFLLLFISFKSYGQQFRTVESGNYVTALAKDHQGNIYATKYDVGSDRYNVVKVNIHDGTSNVIYTGLQYGSVDYVWGLAVDTQGNLFIAASNVDNKVIKLTFNSGTNSYTPSDFITGKYISALAVDDNDNLYVTEYYQPTNKYRLVRYPAGMNTGGTILYDNINLAGGYTYSTSIVLAPNHDIYFNLPFGNSSSPDQGKVLKLSAADNYVSAATVSTGKYSTAIGLDEQGNLYVSEYEAGSANFVLNKYTGATGTPSALYTLDNGDGFYPWGIAVFNSQNIYFSTGSATSHLGGALVQLYDAPISPATNIIPSEQTTTSAKLKWTNGSGARRLVFMLEGNAGTPIVTNNTTYAANSTFGSAATDQSGSWYCVYDGTADSTVVTGIQADHTYRVMVLEYNGIAGAEQYQQTAATDNPVNITAATIQSIVRTDPDSTNSTLVHYTVTFGSPVGGLTASNLSLTTTGTIAGANIGLVIATTPTTYSVDVLRTGGAGELTLNLVNSLGLSPVLVSDLPYVGETYHLTASPAGLTNLVPGEGTLDPVFSTDVISYALTVHNPTLVLTPTAANPGAAIMVNLTPIPSGTTSPPIPLNVGANTVQISVLDPLAGTVNYTLNVDYELPLPVTWINFDMQHQAGKYAWSWQLGVESQVAYYVPQYSVDGIDYLDAGKVTEKNSQHQYHFAKELKATGLIYFRVLAVDNDGSKSYSDIKTISSDASNSALVVFPNPVHTELRLKWPDRKATTLHVAIFNAAGKQVIQRNLQNSEAVTLPVAGLASGVYYLVVVDNLNHQIKSSKFLKK